MIKKLNFRYLTIGLICLMSIMLQAQDTVKLYLEPSLNGDTLILNLKAVNFKSVDNFNISINYSNADLALNLVNLHPNLTVQSTVKDSVFLNFLWTNPNAFPLNLPDNSVLAQFKFVVLHRMVQSCFDFDVNSRPTSFFGILSTVIPVETNNICVNLFGANVSGLLRLDTDGDCVTSANDPMLVGSIIKFKSATSEYNSITKEDGSFDRFLPYGNYTISTINNPLLNSCISTTNVNLDAANISFDYSPSTSATVLCPLLQIEFNAPVFEICKTTQASIRYSNIGTQVSTNAYIELDLDPNLILLQSTFPYSFLGNGKYRFDVGNIDIQQTNQILLNLKTTCNPSFTDRTLQNSVSIFPVSDCIVSPAYTGEELSITGSCINNENVFEIKNTGTSDMKSDLVFNTVEDDIMPNFGGKVKLNKGASQMIKYPANGKTRIIIIDTIANHPYQLRAYAGVEACGTLPNGSVSKGYLNNYAQGDQSPYKSKYSTEIKSTNNQALQIFALPEGAGAPHYISKDDRIFYSFKIQNTTNGIVKRVVLRNEIPATMDINTLQLARSELKYDYNIIDKRTLEIVFDNLALRPVSEDELNSILYFSYSIKPNKELLFNAKIENNAKAYFDNKLSFQSQLIYHTIGNFIFTVNNNIDNKGVEVSVYPNPFENQLKFNFENEGQYQIIFTNSLGETIAIENTSKKLHISEILNAQLGGTYYYQIFDRNLKIASGKIIKSK